MIRGRESLAHLSLAHWGPKGKYSMSNQQEVMKYTHTPTHMQAPPLSIGILVFIKGSVANEMGVVVCNDIA